jgi:GNAT superfamily N-acetyltransferase
MDLECPAEILMLKLGRRISAAVAIIVHRQGESRSELSDLFVWPSYRRQGYGLLLEEFAAERARKAGSSDLGIYLWNSDALKGKDRALSFMRAANYSHIEESPGSQFMAYGKRKIA